MEKKKLRPIDMVAREILEHSTLPNEFAITESIKAVYDLLETRATAALLSDPESADALDKCRQFCIIAEMVDFFGTQLIAYEDIERETIAGRPPAN